MTNRGRDSTLNLSLEQAEGDSVIDLSETYIFGIIVGHDKNMENTSDENSSSSGSHGSGSSTSQTASLRIVETIIRVVPTFSGDSVENYASFVEACELMEDVIPVEQKGPSLKHC